MYDDANRSQTRDPGEAELPGIVVSDQFGVATTGANGAWQLDAAPNARVVFVSVPDGWTPSGAFWRAIPTSAATIDLPLSRRPAASEFTFIHASDTHISAASLPRLKLLRALVEKTKPAFVLITGDLVRDALRVSEAEVRGYYDMFVAELKQFPVPVWTVPGNHEIFGIERDKSKVSTTHRRKADPGDHHSPGDGAGETVAVPSPADVEAFCREFMLLCARYGMVPGRKLPNSETFPADLGKRTYLSIGQLAAYLGDKTIPSARKWLEKNPCVRRSLEGRKVLVWRRDVEAQLERHATQQAKRR